MKWRQMIKTAAALSATPLFFPGSITPVHVAPSVRTELEKIKRFGDGRDWFFEIYIHFHKGISGNGFKLKPINVLPNRAVLLNDNRQVDCIVNLCPSDHLDQKPCLRLRNLPSDEMAYSVMVVKLEFENPLL